jgi:cytochrome c
MNTNPGDSMKARTIALAASVLALLAAGTASANEELAKKSACTACHAVDKKLVGPSYKDVAAKYKGQKDAEAKLFDKVKKGGQGVWGPVPMPANGAVKDEDIKTLVKWVLAQ